MIFNTTTFLERVKLKGALPTGRFTDQEILDFATDCLTAIIAPDVIGAREEYYVRTEDQTIVANQAAYPIPTRSLGMGLREIQVISGTSVEHLERYDVEDETSTAAGTPKGFYLRGNDVILFPTPSTGGDTLRLHYFVRPSSLVTVAECGEITAIDTGTNTITVTVPSGWTTADTFDLVQGKSGFSLKGSDLAATTVNAGSMIMTATLPSTLAVGDYVTLAGESCFPHVPAEGHLLLIHLTVAACLESMGAGEELASAQATSERLRNNLKLLMTNRVQGAARRFARQL